MFNADQRDYMDEMAKVPPEEKCWCCWFLLGKCHTCPPDKTGADKLAARCPECRNDGGPEGRPIVHRKNCSRGTP